MKNIWKYLRRKIDYKKKVDGLAKLIDNQEFVSRGVLIE
jgi:hypothetical protein